MGSGGPRGLQILPSVADRGRGGFDSHTFPPVRGRLRPALLLTLLLAAAAAASSPGAARAQEPGSSAGQPAQPAPAPSSEAEAPRDTVRGEKPRPWHRQPWSIMARSAILPGWGQWVNGRPVKALAALAAEGVSVAMIVDASRDVDQALTDQRNAITIGDPAAEAEATARYNDAYNRRQSWAWVLGAAIVVSMLDAYVDAHLIEFDADFGPDPVLPDDETPGARAGGPDLRVGLRMDFRGP